MFEKDEEMLKYGFTAVENAFLMDYLPAAKGDYVKVYLWGLFSCESKKADYTLEEMAQELFLTVSEVEAALRYWERRALVAKISEKPAQYRFFSPMQRKASPAAHLDVDMEFVSFAESVYAVFGDRRKITPNEIALSWEWVKDIGLKPEVVLMLLNHCIQEKGVQFSFKRAEPLAVQMKENQVSSCEDADHFLHHHQAVHEGARKVLSRLGKRRMASEDELKLYEKWLDEWKFSQEAILNACTETTKGEPNFKYLDGILNGIRTRGDARTGDQVKEQLQKEAEEKEKALAVFSHLGKNVAIAAAIRFYREFTALLPYEAVLLAADECRRSHKNVEDLQALITAWHQKGLNTEEAVREYLFKFREANVALGKLFEACGHSGRPTAADRLLYEKWKGFGMNEELLLFAAEQARVAEGSKIGYLDKVLAMWHEAGITDISQAQARKKPDYAPRGKTVSAQQYTQREYTEEELLAVSDDLIQEARNQRG